MVTTANELLMKEPNQVQAWVEQARCGQIAVPSDFNWLGLAYSAAEAARDLAARGDRAALAWAGAAISVYDYLASEAAADVTSEFERDAMFVRAAMIAGFGAVPGHPVLDIATIERWFIDRLPWSRDEAMSMAENWTQRPIDQIRQLREIKNRLAVIKSVMDAGYLRDNEPLRQWVEIRDSLP